ncbi:hypothetical protein HOY80DRAFT_997170 [Tuber brumale]|nr:hypothetical protein HOY80DRAFT_997170 [Tuber brumale]
MLQRYLHRSRGFSWLQFPLLLTFLMSIILHLPTGYISLTVLDALVVGLLLDTTVEVLYRKTNIYLLGILVVILDLALLVCASIPLTLMPLGKMDGPFKMLPVMYTVSHFLRRLGVDNRVLYLVDFLIFTKVLPESFPPIFSPEFGILTAVLVCVHMCQSPPRIMGRIGPASVGVMATILFVLTPIHFTLALWYYLGVSLSTGAYTLGALWILIIVPGYNLQRFFSTTPLVLSITGGDMIRAAQEVATQERSMRDIGIVLNTRPLIGIDTPWAILDDSNDLDNSSDSDSDYSNPRIPPVSRTIRDRRIPRAIDDPIPLPPSPEEVAAAETSRRRARRYQTGDPPTTPVSNPAEGADEQSTLPPFRWGRPTGNLPESGIANAGIYRLHQRLTRLAGGVEGIGGIGAHTSGLEISRDSFAGPSTTQTGVASQAITQQELPPGTAGAEGGEGPSQGDDELLEVDSPGSLRLPTLFPAGQGRRVTTFGDTTSVRTVSPPDPEPGHPDQPQSQPRPDTPPQPPPPPQPRPQRPTPSRFVTQERIPDFMIPTIVVDDTIVPPTQDTSDPNQPRPPVYWQQESTPIPSSLSRERQDDRTITRSPGARRSPLLPHTFVDPADGTRTPTAAITTATATPATPDNRRPRQPADWELESTSTPPGLRRAQQPDSTTPTRRLRTGRLPRVPHTSPNPASRTTNPAPLTTSTSTTTSRETPTIALGQAEVPEALLAQGDQQNPTDISDRAAERVTRMLVPRRPRLGRALSPPPQSPLPPLPPGPRQSSGIGAEQSRSQTPAPTLEETQMMEEAVVSSMVDHRIRFFSRGVDGQISEDRGNVLEVVQMQSLIDAQQRNISLPPFRQRGSAGGESSAVGGVIGEGVGQLSGLLVVGDDEVPFEGKGKGRARRT